MFQAGKVYKHKNSIDIQYLVASEPRDEEWAVTFVANYWNPGIQSFQGSPEQIRIRKQDFKNWQEVTNDV